MRWSHLPGRDIHSEPPIWPTSARRATLSNAIISTAIAVVAVLFCTFFSLRFASVSKRRSAALQAKHRQTFHFACTNQRNRLLLLLLHIIVYDTAQSRISSRISSQLRCYAGYLDFSFIFIFIFVLQRERPYSHNAIRMRKVFGVNLRARIPF